MNDISTLDTSIIFAYLALMIIVGLYASRKQDTVEDYFVAGGRIGTFSIACLWVASWVGGAAIVGSVGRSYAVGVSGGWYTICMAIGCLLFGLLFAARVKRWGIERNLLTYPDLMESAYDSRTRVVATITTALAYIGFAAGQLAAAGAILSTLLGWDYASALLLASGIIVLYTATGGFLAITYTDWVQFTLLFVGIVIVGIPLAIQQGGTLEALRAQLPMEFFNVTNWGVGTMLAMVVSISMSFFVAMDSYTRMYAARNEATAKRGTLLAVAFLIPISIGTIWIGMTAAILFPGIENGDNVLSEFVIGTFPTGIKGLMLVGILAALMSTADICILTVSANGSRDIYQRYVDPDISPKKMFHLSMGLAAAAGLAAAIMAWQMQDVVSILLVAFTINAAALFVPTVAIVMQDKVSNDAAFWSISLSLTTVILWYAGSSLDLAQIFSIDPLWPGLLVSFIVFVSISQIVRR